MNRKWLSLAAIAALSVSFVGCNSSDGNSVAAAAPQEVLRSVESIKFDPIATPATEAQKLTHSVSHKATVNGVEQAIDYNLLMATGHSDNGEIFGGVKDQNDQPILFDDGNPYICNGTNDGVGSGLDYSSILQANGKLYMVSQFECQIGAMYKFELNQDTTTGALSAKAGTLEFISQKDEFGGFVHCAGQATPWNSHLGSEEYETDARMVEENVDPATGLVGDIGGDELYYNETAKFFGGDATKLSPYYYGWTPEVKINTNGSAAYTKHYAMGRMSHELSFVMPDNKTVYMSDDGENVGLFMFVADKAADLSSGTLYAAKFTQTSGVNGGAFSLEWIELGHNSDASVRAVVATQPMFSDFFTTAEPSGASCPADFSSVNTSWGHECLKIKEGVDENIVAAVETRRYAAMKGATTELRKEEGITFDPVRNKLYIAMSTYERGMENGTSAVKGGTDKYDIGGNNDIRLNDYNLCGAVYELNVGADYKATDMTAILTGEMIEKDANGNKCHLDKISNPDNVTMLVGTDILTIGEDTSSHENNVIWNYNVQTKELSRFFTTSRGAETTSPFWYTNVNGWGYMTAVTQHPDSDTVEAGQSTIGVVGPIDFK